MIVKFPRRRWSNLFLRLSEWAFWNVLPWVGLLGTAAMVFFTGVGVYTTLKGWISGIPGIIVTVLVTFVLAVLTIVAVVFGTFDDDDDEEEGADS